MEETFDYEQWVKIKNKGIHFGKEYFLFYKFSKKTVYAQEYLYSGSLGPRTTYNRIIFENTFLKLGEYLPKDIVIKHLDGDFTNNSIDNLYPAYMGFNKYQSILPLVKQEITVEVLKGRMKIRKQKLRLKSKNRRLNKVNKIKPSITTIIKKILGI